MPYLKADISKPVKYVSAGKFSADKVWIHSERIIDSYEIFICTRGTIFIQQGDIKYILNAGDSILLLPGLVHKGYSSSGKGTQAYWVHFFCGDNANIVDNETVIAEFEILKNNPYFSGFDNLIVIPDYFKSLDMDRVGILFNQLLHLDQFKYYSGQGVDYVLTSLLIELTEQSVEFYNKSSDLDSGDEKFNKIIEWIRVHIKNNISLEDVSFEFNYTKEYLARYFKNKMGMNMHQYILKLKMSKARDMLCNSDMNIKEIAHYLGFADEKYFMKLFKKYEMTTPKSFRSAYYMTHFNN